MYHDIVITEATMMFLDCPVTALPVGQDLPCLRDPELFFAESPQDVEQAKALCRGCRARIACLAGALGRREPWGIWGGELLMNGAIIPRKRPPGRPRKTDLAALARSYVTSYDGAYLPWSQRCGSKVFLTTGIERPPSQRSFRSSEALLQGVTATSD